MKQKIWLWLIFALVAVGIRAQDIRLTASVDPNPVAVGEQFIYRVEVSGSVQNLPEVELPNLDQFALLAGPNVSSSFQIINFSMQASKTYTLYLAARQEGTYQIGPATAKYQGKTYRSNSLRLKVVKQSQKPAARNQGSSRQKTSRSNDLSRWIFLKVIPSKKQVYQNEQVTLTYKFYYRLNIQNYSIEKLPEAAGCWVEDYPLPKRLRVRNEVVNGIQYNVAELKKIAVFPSRAGRVKISPLEMMVEAVIRRRSTRDPFDLFDDFFDNPFGQVVRKLVTSGPVVIEVLPPPENGKPDGFNGLVGDFKIISSLDRTETKTNEAISYKVKIMGNGLLKFLNKLPVEFPPDFEVYEPKIKEHTSKKGELISSEKEFEYVLIPRVAGEFKIGELKIPYFNPADRSYHLLRVPEYTVNVAKGKEIAGLGGAVLSKEEVHLLGQDIHFIKENLPRFRTVGQLPYQSVGFYVMAVLPLFLFAVAFVYRNHLEKMSSNVQYARSRKAHRQARERLKESRRFLKENRVSDFYGAVSKALIGYIADKTNQPAAGLVAEDVLNILRQRQIEGEVLNEMGALLQEADFRRFAPGQADTRQMQLFYKRAENLLVKLSKFF